MKRIDVPIALWDGTMRTEPGYEVPDTAGTLALRRMLGGEQWRLTHIPTGRGISSFALTSRADGIAAAQCLFRACKRMGIDLRRRRNGFKGPQQKALMKACARWCRPVRPIA